MDLKGSVAQLTQAVTTLTEQSKEHGKKLDHISHRMYAAGVVITILLGVTAFFMNKIWDIVAAVLKAAVVH